jgi:hypothetical protein
MGKQSAQRRLIGWMSACKRPVRYDPKVDPTLVLVSVPAMADTLRDGIANFLVNAFQSRRTIMEERAKELLMIFDKNAAADTPGNGATETR